VLAPTITKVRISARDASAAANVVATTVASAVPAARTSSTGVSPALIAFSSSNACASWCGRAFDAGL